MANYNGEKKFKLICPDCKKKDVEFVQSTGIKKDNKIYQCNSCGQMWNNREMKVENRIKAENQILGSSLFRLESYDVQEYYILRENKNSYFVQNKLRNKAFSVQIEEIQVGNEWFKSKRELLKSAIADINLEIDTLKLERSQISKAIKKNRDILVMLKSQK